MRILQVHERYCSGAASGENVVVEREHELLVKRGHQVISFGWDNDCLRAAGIFGEIAAGAMVTWNPWAHWKMRAAIRESDPDVVHVHNIFPILSPAVVHAAKSTGKPVVMTVHNYRQYCAAGNFMHHGVYCQDCYDLQSPLSSIKWACYRDSRIKTLPLAGSITVHQQLGTWRTKVDAFIAQTEFQRGMLVAGGLPPDRVYVKPHFVEAMNATVRWEDRKEQAIFIGRLSQHKGVRVLLAAWRLLGRNAPSLHIVGDGPERPWMAEYIAAAKLDTVILHGHLSDFEKSRLLSESRLLVMPTLWLETFGLVVCEAFACGVPVLASMLGSMGLIVREGLNGALFAPGNAEELANAVRRLWADTGEHQRLARGAAAAYEMHYSPGVNYHRLLEIYSNVIELSGKGCRS